MELHMFNQVQYLRRCYQAYLIMSFGYRDALLVADEVQKITNSWSPENCWALNHE